MQRSRRAAASDICDNILSQALASLQSMTNARGGFLPLDPKILRAIAHAFQGSFPFSVFPTVGSHLPGESHLVRFCCALRVSHPLDALLPPRSAELISSRSRSWGLPFEALFPPTCRTPSRTPPTLLGFGELLGSLDFPTGLRTRRRSRPERRGLARRTCGCPLGLLPLRGFLFPGRGKIRPKSNRCHTPHVLSERGRKLTTSPAPPGHTTR